MKIINHLAICLLSVICFSCGVSPRELEGTWEVSDAKMEVSDDVPAVIVENGKKIYLNSVFEFNSNNRFCLTINESDGYSYKQVGSFCVDSYVLKMVTDSVAFAKNGEWGLLKKKEESMMDFFADTKMQIDDVSSDVLHLSEKLKQGYAYLTLVRTDKK